MDIFLHYVIQLAKVLGVLLVLLLFAVGALLIWAPDSLWMFVRYSLGIAAAGIAIYLVIGILRSHRRD